MAGESPSAKHCLPLNYCFFGVVHKNSTDILQKDQFIMGYSIKQKVRTDCFIFLGNNLNTDKLFVCVALKM
jgi:hypothetical protein